MGRPTGRWQCAAAQESEKIQTNTRWPLRNGIAFAWFKTIMVWHQMPKYSLDEVKALVKADAWELATRTAHRDVLNLDYDRATVCAALCAIEGKDFRKTDGSCNTDFGVIDADVYRLQFNDAEKCRGQGDDLYVKLGIWRDDSCGDLVLVVSLHLTRWL
jgi:hypothetical protein